MLNPQRLLDRQSWFRVRVGPSAIDGKGLFALTSVPARRKLGEFVGERISLTEARERARRLTRIAIVELSRTTAIDATVGGNDFRFVNHSCLPNMYIRCGYSRVEFYALRDINAGEELTCDYGVTHHNGRRPCTCGHERCRTRI